MAELSALAIFWITFAAIMGPVFLISLVCSIRKAVRTRKKIMKRLRGEDQPQNVAEQTVRRKPNIQLIEDEDRKQQFRGNTGSLIYPQKSSYFGPKYKDTDVDRVGAKANKNISNSTAGGENPNKGPCPITTIEDIAPADNKHDHNNIDWISTKTHNHTKRHHNHHYGNAYDNDAMMMTQRHSHTSMANGRAGDSISGRRKSLGDVSSSPSLKPHNGHAIISERANHKGASTLYNHNHHDIDFPGLKPDTHNNNRARRHSAHSISPTLERIPEGKCVEVELNTTRSKSEDNLIDQQPQTSSPPYLTNGGYGSDNQAFARSTETTIM